MSSATSPSPLTVTGVIIGSGAVLTGATVASIWGFIVLSWGNPDSGIGFLAPLGVFAVSVLLIGMFVAGAHRSHAPEPRRPSFGTALATAAVPVTAYALVILAAIVTTKWNALLGDTATWWRFAPLALSCAALLGFFLRSRLALAIACTGAIAILVILILIPTAEQRRATASAEHTAAIQAERTEHRQQYLDAGHYPLVPQLAGWRIGRVWVSTSENVTELLSDSGAAARVTASVTAPFDASAEETPQPCNYLKKLAEEPAADSGALPPWCERTADGWERTDGTGIARLASDGSFRTVTAIEIPSASFASATSSATASDISALDTSLRSMAREDVEAQIADAFLTQDTLVQTEIVIEP